MTSRLPQFTLRFRLSALLACACIAGWLLPASNARAADPEITSQPRSGIAAPGEPFAFSVAANGTEPLHYQWFRGNSALAGRTNRELSLLTVTNSDAATYSVVVSNAFGSVTSAPVTLTLVSSPRLITTGTVQGGLMAMVPLLLSANGREHRLSFALGFDTNVFGNPSFMGGVSGSASFDDSRAGEGLVSGEVSLTEGEVFEPGRTIAGHLQFDFVSGTNPLAGGLYFTNFSATATNVAFTTNGLALAADAAVSPQFEVLAPAPALNRQSGLFEQVLRVAYPGAGTLSNVDVLMSGIGVDSLTNQIRAYNSTGTRTFGPDAGGIIKSAPYFSMGPLAGGQARDVTAEYYVSDHLTVPTPEYLLQVANRIVFTLPSSATPLNITTNRFVNGTFIIQFPTRTDYRYFVQYAPTLNDLVNATTNSRVANPAVGGTGHDVQWIDNGPPKTESPPVAGSRFYRVLEVRAE